MRRLRTEPLLLGLICFIIIGLGFGSYTLYLTIIGMREENESYDVIVNAPPNSEPELIARMLLNESFNHYVQRKVISRIDEYHIHAIQIIETQPDYFIFEAEYSLRTPDGKDSNWALNHTGVIEDTWIRNSEQRFRATLLPEGTYRLTVASVEPVVP